MVNSTVCCSLNYYTSILFVLHKCRSFFTVAHFWYSHCRLFCALRCCLLLLQLYLLLKHLRSFAFSPFFTGFDTFVFFTVRCQLFFILRCHLFFFINSCAFSNYPSFLLPDEASGRNVVISTACCSSVRCSLTYYR